MTHAVVFAVVPGSEGTAALLPSEGTTLLRRNLGMLRAAGIKRITVICTTPLVDACRRAIADDTVDIVGVYDVAESLVRGAETCSSSEGRVLFVDGAIVTHLGNVTGLLRNPRIASGLLVGYPEDGWPLRVERGRVVSVSSAFHHASDPTGSLAGMMVVADEDKEVLVANARRLASLMTPESLPAAWQDALERTERSWTADEEPGRLKTRSAAVSLRAAAALDPLALLAVGLVRGDAFVRCSYVRQLYWARPLSVEQVATATAAMASIDEERVLMNSAVKVNDGFFGTFFCSPYTKYIARGFAKLGIRPNQVTVFSFLLGVASAFAFSRGTFVARVAGALLLYFTLAFDCVDGQLARYSKHFTTLGAWLDPMFDRAKEYAVYAALAFGAIRLGADPEPIWLLAVATLAFQTLRHHMDFAFAAGRQEVIASARKPPLEEPWDEPHRAADELVSLDGQDEEQDESGEAHDNARPSADGGLLGRVLQLSSTANRFGWAVWIKRIIQFPIGERYAAICIAGVLGGARAVFPVMLIWGAVSMLYMTSGRILRTAR